MVSLGLWLGVEVGEEKVEEVGVEDGMALGVEGKEEDMCIFVWQVCNVYVSTGYGTIFYNFYQTWFSGLCRKEMDDFQDGGWNLPASSRLNTSLTSPHPHLILNIKLIMMMMS